MKKIFKATLAVAAIAAAGMGSYKAYDSYVASNMSEDDLLLAENIEALASDESDTEIVALKGKANYKCWSRIHFGTQKCTTHSNVTLNIYEFGEPTKITYFLAGKCQRWYAEENHLETMYFSDQYCSHPSTSATTDNPNETVAPPSQVDSCPLCNNIKK